VASAVIKISQHTASPYEWTASLWFTNAGGEGQPMRWNQLSFMAVFGERHYQPFAANPSSSEATHAFRGGLGSAQFAETPRPVDLEDFEDFADEWTDRFALAVKGQLRHPGYLPFAGSQARVILR
jgi:hypothetical protein